MNFVPVKIPWLAKRVFPNFVWDMSAHDKTIYLTFDDGPTPEITPWTLELLETYNAKASFFCIGANIEKYPEIFKSVVTAGHTLGNHSQNHLKGWETNNVNYIDNIEQAQAVMHDHGFSLKDATGTRSSRAKLFRPPFGRIKPSQGRALIDLGYTILMWTIISFDWEQEVSPETCLKNVIDNAAAGHIIVFHDSVKASKNMKYVLPKVLEHFSKKGYRFKAIDL